MIVRVEAAETGYKGSKEFTTGQIIADVSMKTVLLPENIDADKYVPYKFHLPEGEFWFVDVNAEVQAGSLLIGGIARKRTADAPKQTIVVDRHFTQRPFPVFVRHENIPYKAQLKFDLADSSTAGESENRQFIKKYGWYL